MARTSSFCHSGLSGPKDKDRYEAVSAVALTAADCARAALIKAVKQEREVEDLKKELGFLLREMSVLEAQQAETVKHVERVSCQVNTILSLLKQHAKDIDPASTSSSVTTDSEKKVHAFSNNQPVVSVTTPRHFKGDSKESFEDYLEHFKAVALLNGWDDQTSALQLQVYLDGHAQKLALELDEESRFNYSSLIEHLKSRFCKPADSQEYVREFYLRKKASDEAPRDFASALTRLSRHAFKGHGKDEVEGLIKEQLIKGYDEPQVAIALSMMKNCSLKQLIDTAVDVSALCKGPVRTTAHKPMIAQVQMEKDESCVCTGKQGCYNLDMLKSELSKEIQQMQVAFTKEMEKLQSCEYNGKPTSTGRSYSPSIQRRGSAFNGTCHWRGFYGHMARYCPSRRCNHCGKNGHTIDNCWNLVPQSRNPSQNLPPAPITTPGNINPSVQSKDFLDSGQQTAPVQRK